MKKIVFCLICFTLFVGCKTPTPIIPQASIQQLEAKKPTVWKQSHYPKLEVGDPIVFLNSSEIVIEGSYSTETYFLQDGTIIRMDSVQTITKRVPIYTKGILVSMEKNTDGLIGEMNVSFSQSDETYTFNFRFKADGSFTLNGNAKLFFQGKEYTVVANKKGDECLLLINFKTQKDTQVVNEQAEGQNATGIKIIK